MTVDEACQELGVPPSASREEILAAYRARAKSTHPDFNGGGSEAEAQFRRVQEAYQALRRHGSLIIYDPAVAEEGASENRPTSPAVQVVRDFLARYDIEILFDGSLRRRTAPCMAFSPAEIGAYLTLEEIDGLWLLDEIMLELRALDVKISKGDIERAIRKVVRTDQRRRRNAVVTPLLTPESDPDRAASAQAWARLAEAVFETDPPLAAACLQHFVWQVKQKLLGRPIKHHLMPVVWSPVQGCGKTTFVLKFLGPLRELATGPVLLSDFADRRSGDIYRFPALFVDDMERIEPALIPVLKGLVTSEGFCRRRLGTSLSDQIRQRATLIGTANRTIDALVADDTGNRRFASLQFRNGAVAKGGDPGVWEAVDATDYELLWRSVDGFGPGPIEAHLDALVALQEMGRPRDPLLTWLRELDVNVQAVKNITTRDGVLAKPFYELFCEQTGITMTLSRFGTEMRRHASDPAVPFEVRVEKPYGKVYPLKPRPAAAA